MDFGTFFSEKSPLAIVKYWSNYADSAEIPVSEENGWEILRSGTEDFVHDLCRRADRRVEKEWENRRKPQILSGNSKFSHTEGCREYRHTLWYEPAPMPPETELLAEELPEEKAERLWLDSFRNQLLCRRMEKVPLIFEKKQGKCRIFSLLYKKNSYFC